MTASDDVKTGAGHGSIPLDVKGNRNRNFSAELQIRVGLV